MKAIIYAGIGLFSVATVYGIADYYNTQKKGTLDKLYREEEPVKIPEKTFVPPALSPVNNTVAVNPKDQQLVLNSISKKIRSGRIPKRTIRLNEFSRGRIEEAIVIDPQPVVPVAPVKVEEPKLIEPVAKPAQAIKPDRKISLAMFSRAPLRVREKTEAPAKPDKMN